MPLHSILALLIIVLVVLGIVALVRSLFGSPHRAAGRDRSPGLDALEERYARGEIQRDEYLLKKRDLGG